MTITLARHDVSTTATAATGELSPGFFVSEAEERALRLIGGWLDESSRRARAGEHASEESTANFYAWLDDPRDRRAKERALDIIMEGCRDALHPDPHPALHHDLHHDPYHDPHHDPHPDQHDPDQHPGDCLIDDHTHTVFNIHSY